jgi:hypothetical protein
MAPQRAILLTVLSEAELAILSVKIEQLNNTLTRPSQSCFHLSLLFYNVLNELQHFITLTQILTLALFIFVLFLSCCHAQTELNRL